MRVRVAPGPYNDRYARVIGSQLTPTAVTAVLREADVGYLWSLADLLDEMRERDTHMDGVLRKRELQVAGAPWEVRPAEGAGARGQRVADWCRDRLREIEAPDDLDRSFDDAMCDLQGAVYHGRAALEVVWRSAGRAGQYLVPDRLGFVHPRRLAYATDWHLHLWDMFGSMTSVAHADPRAAGLYPGIPLGAFPPGKFLVHRPRVRGVYPTREGLGRTLVWWAMFKRFGVRDWLALVEWAGRGLRVGTYASGKDGATKTPPEDQDALMEALETLSSSIATTIPDTTTIAIHDAPNTRDVHARLLATCNNEMSKAILGETLTTEVGSTGGNRALGQVHDDVRLMIARADARSLAQTVRRCLLRPMVELNFGTGAPVPTIAWTVDPSDDLDAFTDRIVKLVRDAGLQVGQGYVRDRLGIDDPAPGEPLLAVLGAPSGVASVETAPVADATVPLGGIDPPGV
jgi:phage gp29-like protein